MKDTVENVTNVGAEFMQKGYDRMIGSTKDQVEKASATAFKAYEELSKFQKDTLDAYSTASTIVTKGFETMGKQWATYTREAMEANAEAARSLLGAKSLNEAVELQSEWVKTAFDKAMAEGTKLSEISVKVANEALEPISARVTVAVEKLFKPLAA
ncbi:MAG: phasin family protein [Proteobacteria bacterium]|nr:phasin family protein [Pseudomonadota bacterium]